MLELLQKYIDENLVVENRMMSRGIGNYFYSEEEINQNNNTNKEYKKKTSFKNKFNLKNVFFDEVIVDDKKELSDKENVTLKELFNVDDFVQQKENYSNFQTLLFKLIDDRNLKDSDVYNKVHMDRRLFSKLRNNDYHPSKETIILLGLSLELSENEIDELLESASYSLPKNNHYDLIIRFCFINKIFKLDEINNLLDKYNCKLFSY